MKKLPNVIYGRGLKILSPHQELWRCWVSLNLSYEASPKRQRYELRTFYPHPYITLRYLSIEHYPRNQIKLIRKITSRSVGFS